MCAAERRCAAYRSLPETNAGDGRLGIKEFERSLKESRLTTEGREDPNSLFQFADLLRRLADRMDNSTESLDALFAVSAHPHRFASHRSV